MENLRGIKKKIYGFRGIIIIIIEFQFKWNLASQDWVFNYYENNEQWIFFIFLIVITILL